MIKLLITFGVYIGLVLTLGFVLALTASREGFNPDVQDEEE